MAYLYNSWDLNYKNPFGAMAQTSFCNFAIYIPVDVHLDYDPVLVTFRTGYKERFLPMNLDRYEDGCAVYTTTYRPKYAGVHYYYFSYTSDSIRHYIKRGDACHGTLDMGDMFQLTVYSGDYKTPDFLKGGIMYQIFPDRFCKSGEAHENVPGDRVMREWGELPYYLPDENGHVWNNDYFGGDLKGIESKLDYLADLGVTCIYLNPIFESHENHRYATANYRKVDPLLGTNEEFKELCDAAKEKGISIILDGVFSHTGADSIYFNKNGRYPEPGAYQDEPSPYDSWYHFWDGKNKYEAWWGIDTLPNVDENNPSYTHYICGEGGVLEYWLSMGAAGFRLDVADELPDEFLDHLRSCVKHYDEDKIVIGEVWEDASNKESYGVKRRYLLGDQLDSVMNYPFKEAILGYIQGDEVHYFRDRIMTILENYPKCTVDVLMNFVSTHDIERAINRLGGPSCEGKDKTWMANRPLTWEEYDKGKALLKCAMVLQFFLPGVPCIYYGDEVGLQGWKDPFNRQCYPWGHEDTDLLYFTKQLAHIRHTHDVFKEGNMEFLVLDPDVVGFSRYDPETGYSVLIFLNRCGEQRSVPLTDARFQSYQFSTVISGICDNDVVQLPAYSYAALAGLRIQL